MDILKLLRQLSSWALTLLPDFPFQALDTSPTTSYLSAISWIVPVSLIVATMETWLVAVAAYYVILAALRWAHAIS